MFPIIPLPGGLYLPSYFLLITLGYCIGVYWLFKRAENYDLSTRSAMDAAIIIMVGGFIGSRLFHVFFELPDFYMENPIHILKVWQGGFVFYGGAIGAVVPVYILFRLRKEPIQGWLDVFTPIVPLVYGIGRFATLLSGSGYGKPTSLPWGIRYPPGTEAPAGVSLHPTPLYAVAWESMILALSLWILHIQSTHKKTWKPSAGFAFGVMISLHGVGRAVIEQFRDDFRGEFIAGLSISTWMSMAIVSLGLGICWNTWKRPVVH